MVLGIGLIVSGLGMGSPASAFDAAQCSEWAKNEQPPGSFFNVAFTRKSNTKGAAIAYVDFVGCSLLHGGQTYIYRVNEPQRKYPLALTGYYDDFGRRDVDNVWTSFFYEFRLETLPSGTYRLGYEGFYDDFGNKFESPMATEVVGSVRKPIEIIWEGVDTSTTTLAPKSTTTTSIPIVEVPEVLDDSMNLVVHKANFFASVHYSAVVRCSTVCGSLPDRFNARLCEVGTGYSSFTCLATATMSSYRSKKIVTKNSSTNLFLGSFVFQKKPTGKTYKVFLNIPAGKNRKPVQGLSNIKWNKSTLNLPMANVATVPTTTAAPGASTTTIAGTSPSTTSNVASSAALTVTSDSISGKSSLTVKGNGAAVTIDAAIKCSGQCTKLPASILGRLCKVGTSYTDASCTSIITLYPASGATPTSATFRGNTTFGTSPTGAVYQPFFSMTATGISGTTRLSGTSRVTWTK